MPDYQVRTETLQIGGEDWHIRRLSDDQQYADADNTAADIGLPPAGWSHFGQLWPSSRVLALAMLTYPLEGLRRRGWCTMCGSWGAYTHTPSHADMKIGDQPYVEERSYHHHLRALEEAGRRSYVVYDDHTRSIRRDSLTIGQALRWAARANGIGINGEGRYDSFHVTLIKDREVICRLPAPLTRDETANRWTKVCGLRRCVPGRPTRHCRDAHLQRRRGSRIEDCAIYD